MAHLINTVTLNLVQGLSNIPNGDKMLKQVQHDDRVPKFINY